MTVATCGAQRAPAKPKALPESNKRGDSESDDDGNDDDDEAANELRKLQLGLADVDG